MITARQSRAARALLGWTQETLADKARISLTALKRLESESGSRCMRQRVIRCGGRLKQQGSFSCPRIAGKECCWFMIRTRKDTRKAMMPGWRGLNCRRADDTACVIW